MRASSTRGLAPAALSLAKSIIVSLVRRPFRSCFDYRHAVAKTTAEKGCVAATSAVDTRSRRPLSSRRTCVLDPDLPAFQDIQTPALVLDSRALARNISGMAAFAKAHGIGLRPHAK